MANWSKQSVSAEQINNGQEYKDGDFLSSQQLNSIVNNSLYAQERADEVTKRVVDGHGTAIYLKSLNNWKAPTAIAEKTRYFFDGSTFFTQDQQENPNLPAPFKFSFEVPTSYIYTEGGGGSGLLPSAYTVNMLTNESLVQFVNLDPEVFAEYGLFIADANVSAQTLTIYTTKVPETSETIPFEIMIEG